MPSDLRLRAAAASILAGALLSGCRKPGPVALDLASAAALAEHHAAWELVVFGGPAGEAAQGPGLVGAVSQPTEDGHVWAAVRSELFFRWPTAERRVVLLDMAPHPELDGQEADVFLNDEAVGHLVLDAGRRRYALELPAAAQRPGRNTLRLAFAKGSAPQKPHRLRLGAVLYGVAAGPAAERTLSDLGVQAAPAPLSAGVADGLPTLTQVGPSSVRFAFAAPAGAELRFTPELHPLARTAGSAAAFRVTLEEDSGAERELWSGTRNAASGRSREVTVPLGVPAGRIVRLGLHVEGAHRAWGVWIAPRLVGAGPIQPEITRRVPAPEASPSAAPASPPTEGLPGANVLIVLLDAAGARHFSCYGYARETTPEIDRIARESTVFERAYSPVGFTLLAVSSLWTSQLPDQHHNGIPYNAKLPRGATTLAELLSARKVPAAAFIDNVFAGSAYGLDQGFAEFDEVYKRFPRSGAEIFGQILPPWLEAHKQQRFFAYLHYREPHFPYNPQPPFNTLFGPDAPLPRAAKTELDWLTDVNWKRKTASPAELEHLGRLYDGNLRFVDGEVGALRRALEAAGLWDRTLVIVTADHGEALHEHGFIGHLNQVYEDAVHIPLILHFPKGSGPAPGRVRSLVSLIDLAPTVADVFGIRGESFLGHSLLPVAAGGRGHEALVARSAEDQPKYALHHDHWKLVYYTARGDAELYDLAADPREREDLARSQPVRVAYYRQSLFRWLAETRRGPRTATEEVQLSEEQKENLRALGYVQ